MNEIIISDEIKRLKEEIVILKGILATLSEEKNYLVYVECPRILALYMEKIGDYVNRINYQELLISELKYRIMAIQAVINRDETLDKKKLDEDVKQEYAEYQQRVDEQFKESSRLQEEQREREETRRENEEKYKKSREERQDEDIDSEKDQDSREDTKERPSDDEDLKDLTVSQKIKEIYRRIVKKIHPDVNPDITEHEKELLNKANVAYRDGDLEELEDIYDELFGLGEFETLESEESIEVLMERISKLNAKITELRNDIEHLKTSFPYSEKELLENDEEVSKKQAMYNRIIEAYERLIKELQTELDGLINQLAGKIINDVMEEKSNETDIVDS